MSSSPDSDVEVPDASQHPFNRPSADLILRSSDNIDFRVHKAILAEASSVFEDMFSLGVSSSSSVLEVDPSERKDGLDVVRLSEDGGTVEALLRYCYPSFSPTVGTLQQYQTYLSAAEKYSMEWVVTQLKMQITSELEKVMQDDPLRAYAIAFRSNLADEAKQAAKLSLRRPLVPNGEIEELAFITAASHQKLLVYRFQCMAVMDSLMQYITRYSHLPMVNSKGEEVKYRPDHSYKTKPKYGLICQARSEGGTPIWFSDYLEQTRRAFRDRVCGDVAKSPEILQWTLKNISRCPMCSKSEPTKFLRFSAQFAELLDEEIDKISFPPIYGAVYKPPLRSEVQLVLGL